MTRWIRAGLAVSTAIVGVLGAPAGTEAQIAAANRSGVAMGHAHFIVRDVAANSRFWTALGGEAVKGSSTITFKFPGLLILLTPGTPQGDGTGLVIDHIAFRARSLDRTLAAVKEAGFRVEPPAQIPNTARAYTPDGYKIEIFDAISESPRYFPESDQRDSDWERHMQPMTVPIVSQHIHYYLRAGDEPAAKAWYHKMFGGTPGRRLQYAAVDLPGVNLNFSISSTPAAPPSTPTKGRTLDHIGFEVRDLAAFCRKLEAAGVKFEAPYTKHQDGVATASLIDPWGATIELTEGLRGL
jgi:catechol 2,3-dioxygenase-like lactoylglutathione lyase family enzyme